MKKKMVSTMLVLAMMVSGSVEINVRAAESGLEDLDTSEYEELVLYVIGDKPNRQNEIDENFNSLAKEKLNCSLKINWLSWAEYSNKYPLLFSSGEEFDLAYTASWLNFSSLAQKGAFKNLDELWPTYAPDNFALQSDSAKQQATVDGHYYCIPTLLPTYNLNAVPTYRTDVVDGLNWSGKMDTFEDMEEYLQLVKDNHPEMEPLDIYSSGSNVDDLWMHNKGYTSPIGTNFLWIDPSEESPEVFTFYDTENIDEFLSMMSDWNEKGFFSKSALSDTDSSKIKNGKAAMKMDTLDFYTDCYIAHPEWNFDVGINLYTDVAYNSYTQDALVVSNTSKNPERALALYNWITTDEEAFRAFYYGIEGTSYTIHENGQVEMLNTEDFAASNLWAARTKEFTLDSWGSPENLSELKASLDTKIVEDKGAQKYSSFVADLSSVETEYAACQNVHQQYWWPLELGYTNKEKGLEEYKSMMEAAGIEKIKEVVQQQLNDYLNNQK